MIIREGRLDDSGYCDWLGLFRWTVKPFAGNARIVWIDVNEPLVSVQRKHLLAVRAAACPRWPRVPAMARVMQRKRRR